MNRLKSFAWRLGGAIVVFSLAWITDNIESLGLPVIVTGLISLIIPEITKFINSYQKSMGRSFLGRKI